MYNIHLDTKLFLAYTPDMRCTPLPPHFDLLMMFDYNPATGALKYSTGRNRGRSAGSKEFNSKGEKDRIRVTLGPRGDRVAFAAHRLIWKYMTGIDPVDTVDHADCDPFNNSWSNLREANNTQQQANKHQQSNNRTGFKGVVLLPSGRYAAYIGKDKNGKYLGAYDTPQEANAVYIRAASSKYGGYYRGE
jgi:hypothetical protein